ncbi:hypothetical protein ABZV75_29560 [Streptomyces flaveolus]|uniref:hypothetical protein n=1 Tax=Streptomyces flaveolus TaxID=67297 RepID=UPI00339E67C1
MRRWWAVTVRPTAAPTVRPPVIAVLLMGVGERRKDVVQALRAVTGLSAWRSARLMDTAPVPAVGGTWFEAAVRAAARLRGAGVDVEAVCGGCARTLPRDGRPLGPGPCAARHWSASDCGREPVLRHATAVPCTGTPPV